MKQTVWEVNEDYLVPEYETESEQIDYIGSFENSPVEEEVEEEIEIEVISVTSEGGCRKSTFDF